MVETKELSSEALKAWEEIFGKQDKLFDKFIDELAKQVMAKVMEKLAENDKRN